MYMELLESARVLANLDTHRPKQANLRRSLSNAYYSLFHYLIDASCRAMIGTQHADRSYRNVLSRAFQHNEMSRCCKCFQNGVGGLPEFIKNTIPELSVDSRICGIAKTFFDLQQLRTDADYNLATQFSRTEVVGQIELVQVVIEQFDSLPLDHSKRLFLSCLWSWDRIKGR